MTTCVEESVERHSVRVSVGVGCSGIESCSEGGHLAELYTVAGIDVATHILREADTEELVVVF